LAGVLINGKKGFTIKKINSPNQKFKELSL